MYTTAADLPSWAPHRRPRPRYPPYRSPPSPQALSRARALLRRLARSPPSRACPPAAMTRGPPATTSSPPSHAHSPSDGDELATLLRALALRNSETLGDLGSGNGEQKREGEEHHRRRVTPKCHLPRTHATRAQVPCCRDRLPRCRTRGRPVREISILGRASYGPKTEAYFVQIAFVHFLAFEIRQIRL
jgi:hypothetical protein